MIEVRFHGRGGQGVVLAAEILAHAAFLEGREVQSFPFFGVERRGAPVTAFARVSDGPIRIRSMVRQPDYVLVLDPSLLSSEDVAAGLREEGLLLASGPPGTRLPTEGPFQKVLFNATDVSLKHGLGTPTAPIVNTVLLGAFAAASGLVTLVSLVEAVRARVPSKVEANVAACREAFERMQEEVGLVAL